MYYKEKNDITLETIFADVQKALKAGCFFAAATLALAIPDVCGKAKYPDEQSNKKRYINWLETEGFIIDYPQLDGEIIYSLRCQMLHQLCLSVNTNAEEYTDYNFVFKIEPQNEMGIAADSITEISFDELKPHNIVYELDLSNLCRELTEAGLTFYQNNKEKFGFTKNNLKYANY